MKKLICIFLSCILVFNSVIVYADTSGSFDPYERVKEEHPDWFDSNGYVKPAGSELFSHMVVPDLIGGEEVVNKIASLTGAIQDFLGDYDNSNDDVTIQYDDKGETVTENNYSEKNFYFTFNNKFTTALTQKVQDAVHALDGYYLIEPQGKSPQEFIKDNDLSENSVATFTKYLNDNNFQSILPVSDGYYYMICPPNIYYYIVYNEGGYRGDYELHAYDKNHDSWDCNRYCFLPSSMGGINFVSNKPPFAFGQTPEHLCRMLATNEYSYGLPVKIFYSKEALQNYFSNNEKRTYSPKLPSGGLKIPLSYIKGTAKLPDLNVNLDSLIGKAEADIQADIDLALKNYFDKLLELNNNPSQPTNPTPTPSHGGSGGDFGDGTTPTPTPSIGDGGGGDDSGGGKVDLSETNNWLKKIYDWLTSFGDSHTKFEKTITDYIEANDGKLDQIIDAIDKLSQGKEDGEDYKCKYDYTELSDYLKKLWNDSDKKFDTMIDLLEENNEYQQKLVDTLDSIKSILIKQSVMDSFKDRSKETADKAKEKFPTSVPWDIAIVINAMSATPEKPKFNLPIKIASLNIDENIEVDLSSGEWEKLAKTCRYMLSLLFVLFMVQLSRRLFFNKGDDD